MFFDVFERLAVYSWCSAIGFAAFALTTLNTAVFAPIRSASVDTPCAKKAGRLNNVGRLRWTFFQNVLTWSFSLRVRECAARSLQVEALIRDQDEAIVFEIDFDIFGFA